jgi:NhaP-type Na+/H+ or K+/H+ antiporter
VEHRDSLTLIYKHSLIIRPLGAWISTIGQQSNPIRPWLFGWFGIRGVGSLYYLFYSLGEGLKDEAGEQIAWITLITVVLSGAENFL